MAMGLERLGRGARLRIALLHALGGAVGGAVTGAAFGLVGGLAGADDVRPWIFGATATAAFLLSLGRRVRPLGRLRQVPQEWGRRMPLGRRFFLWGTLLGAGAATLIPYPSYLIVLGGQLASGPLLATAIGAVFGAVREGLPLWPALRSGDSDAISDLLPRMQGRARSFNLVVIALVAVAVGAATFS